MDMEQRDYDSRTALHVAAAEGKDAAPSAMWFSDLLSTRHSTLPALCWLQVTLKS